MTRPARGHPQAQPAQTEALRVGLLEKLVAEKDTRLTAGTSRSPRCGGVVRALTDVEIDLGGHSCQILGHKQRSGPKGSGHRRLRALPVLLLKGEELPVAFDSLQLVPAPVLELDVRAEQQVPDRAGHEHLTGHGAGQDPGGDVDGDP